MAPIVLSCLTRHYFRPLVMSGGNVLLNWNGMHQIISDYYWRRWLIQITLVARSLAQRGAWRWGTICHWHSLKMHCASCKMWWVTHVCVGFGHSHHMSSNQEFQTAAILTFFRLANNFETTLRIQLPHKWGLHYLVAFRFAFPTHVTSAWGQPLSWCFLSETPTLIDSSYWNYGKGFECVMGC